jgi:hypothetical protein
MPDVRITRFGEDITSSVVTFQTKRYASGGGQLVLQPPKSTKGVVITATWRGDDYAIWDESES